MLLSSAIQHFGSRHAIAKALAGSRSVSAVYQWGEVVPRAAAKRLETISNHALVVDESLYDELGNIRKTEQAA